MGNELLVGRFDTNIDSKGKVKLPEEWGFAFGPGKLIYVVPADFLFRSGFDELVRDQGAYVSDTEMSELVSAAVEKYGSPKYAEDEK